MKKIDKVITGEERAYAFQWFRVSAIEMEELTFNDPVVEEFWKESTALSKVEGRYERNKERYLVYFADVHNMLLDLMGEAPAILFRDAFDKCAKLMFEHFVYSQWMGRAGHHYRMSHTFDAFERDRDFMNKESLRRERDALNRLLKSCKNKTQTDTKITEAFHMLVAIVVDDCIGVLSEHNQGKRLRTEDYELWKGIKERQEILKIINERDTLLLGAEESSGEEKDGTGRKGGGGKRASRL